jgi:hypothetical protein
VIAAATRVRFRTNAGHHVPRVDVRGRDGEWRPDHDQSEYGYVILDQPVDHGRRTVIRAHTSDLRIIP